MRSSNEMVSQRRDKVLDYISTTGKTTTELLAKEFGVSIMTARRNLPPVCSWWTIIQCL